MKKLRKTKTAFLATLLLIIGVAFVSCSKETQAIDDLNTDQITGSYTGTFSFEGLKSGTDAHADVELNNDSTINIHCYGGVIDTTFMLQIFENNDSIMLCLTGNDFFNEYGHQSGHQGDMMGGSGHMNTGSSDWDHHMSDSHNDDDLHFGGFDTMNHSFSYSFRNPSNSSSLIHFIGTKDSGQ